MAGARWVVTFLVVLLLNPTPTFPPAHIEPVDDANGMTGIGPTTGAGGSHPAPRELLSGIAGSFTENLGQEGTGAGRYYCRGSGLSVALGDGWVAYDYMAEDAGEGVLVRVEFVGASDAVPVGVDPLQQASNYLIGNDRSQWVIGARSYGSVVYRGIYDGIDLVYRFDGAGLKYEFVASPHADVSQVHLRYSGQDGLRIDPGTGGLIIRTPVVDLVDQAPLSYQVGEGASEPVDTSFMLLDERTVAFDVDRFDPRLPLIIDPGLNFSTYFGGDSDEGARMVVDETGDVYLAGDTASIYFPTTPGAYQRDYSLGADGFACKLKGDGSGLVFSTFLAYMGNEDFWDFILDDEKDLVMTGYTTATDLPTTPGSLQPSLRGGQDCIVMELDGNGTDVHWATYLGGALDDAGRMVARMSNGDIIVAGMTGSVDFPTVNGFDNSYNGSGDSFVARIANDGTRLIASTYIGGLNSDLVGDDALFVDEHDGIYLGLWTCSGDLPSSPNAFLKKKPNYKTLDVALVKFAPDLGSLAYLTYLGGFGDECPQSITVDEEGCVYVTGNTTSTDFPTTLGAYDPYFNESSDVEAFISKVSPDGSSLEFSTYIGGGGVSQIPDIGLGENGTLYFVMNTTSDLLPTTADAIYAHRVGQEDMFIGVLDWVNQTLLYGSYLGGTDDDGDYACIHVDGRTVTVSGCTLSPDYPTTPGAFQRYPNGFNDIGVSRFDILLSTPVIPDPPRNLTALLYDGTVRLSWEPPSSTGGLGLMGYRLYRGGTVADMALHADIAPRSTGANDTALVDGASYNYSLTARTAFGESLRSNVAEVLYILPPWPPTGLAVWSMCGTVRLTWSAPSKAVAYPVLGYHVLRGTAPSDMAPLVTTGNVTSYDDLDVQNGRTYYYKVASFNRGGVSNFTLPLSGLPTGPPTEPLDPRAVAGVTNVTLGWSAPVTDGGRPLLGYRVLRGPSPGALAFLMEVGPRTTGIVDSGLSDHVPYYYAVRAFNSLGEGPLSPAVPMTPFTAPGPPAGFEVTAGFQSAELTWDAPSDDGGMAVRGFIVRRGLSAGRLDPLAMLGGASYGYSDGHTPYRRTVYYAVSAYNDAGEGPPTIVLSALPMTLPDPPDSVVATDGLGSITLTWAYPPQDGGSSVTQYLIYRGSTLTGLSRIGTVAGATLSYPDTTIEPGVPYYYAISAVTPVGQGPRCAVVEATAFDLPSAPLGLSHRVEGGGVVLAWSPPSRDGGRPILQYTVYKGTDVASMARIAVVSDGTSYSDDRVVANETYLYAITALNAIGEGPRTPPLLVRPEASLLSPGRPTGLRALTERTTVRLVWLPPEAGSGGPVTGYRVYRGPAPSDLKCVGTVGLVPSYKDSGLDVDRTYMYAITAVNGAGEGGRSPIVTVEITSIEAIRPTPGPFAWALLVAFVVVVIIAAAAVSIEVVRYALVLLLLPLFTRFKREQVLANKTRYSIHGLIIDRPGINFTAIIEDLELPLGVATYHLDVLERENFVKSTRDGRLKRFYSTDSAIPKEFRLSPEALRVKILELIADRPGMSQKEIIRDMGVEREIVGYHLRELVKDGSVRDAKVGRYKVYSISKRGARDVEGHSYRPEHHDTMSRRG